MFRKLLALILFAVPGVAHADWYEASTAHFVVYSEDKPDKLKVFANNLERFDKALRVLRDLPDDPVGKANRVTVYVVGNVDKIEKLAHDDGVAGFYIPRAGQSVAFVPRSSGTGDETDLSPLEILLHEYTHHFLLSIYPENTYPTWFVEGYAEYFAPTSFDKDGSVLVGNPPLYRAYGLLNGNLLPMDKLIRADALKLNDQQREGLYGRGWLLTHYLFSSGKRPGQLGDYFRALNAGTPPLEAAKVFGDLRVLDRELDNYLTVRLSGLRIPAARLPVAEVAMRKLTEGEAATMDVRIRSKVGVDDKTAPAVYAAATKACAPFPNDRGAQLVLAEAAYDAGDYAVSEAAAARAFAADPTSVDALLYQARSKMAVAQKVKDMAPATWSAIRKLIGTANRLDVEDPEPLILYFDSFTASGQVPPKMAREGLYYAYVLAPQDPGLRFQTAETYLQDGNSAKARALLMTLAVDPHDKGLGEVAAGIVAQIDAGHADSALKVLEGGAGESGGAAKGGDGASAGGTGAAPKPAGG